MVFFYVLWKTTTIEDDNDQEIDYQQEKVQHNDASNNNERIVRIPFSSNDRGEPIILEGSLTIPTNAKGIVIFAHGSGSSRHSTRNRYVAQVLNNDGISTLLIDLLTPEEEGFDLKAQKNNIQSTWDYIKQN